MSLKQVWNWNSFQRRKDSLMNKAYIKACQRLVIKSQSYPPGEGNHFLDLGAGSGLVLRMLTEILNTEKFTYCGFDLSSHGLELLHQRAKQLQLKESVSTIQGDVTKFEVSLAQTFNRVYSNFCLYTIRDRNSRIGALKNIKQYLKPSGTFHIALPSEYYSARNIAIQCIKDECNDDQNIFIKLIRILILVPYQWQFVLKPIEQMVKKKQFVYFTRESIEIEFREAGLSISEIHLDYGKCGYHIHGRI